MGACIGIIANLYARMLDRRPQKDGSLVNSAVRQDEWMARFGIWKLSRRRGCHDDVPESIQIGLADLRATTIPILTLG